MHHGTERSCTTYGIPRDALAHEIGLSIAIEVSVVVCKESTSRNSRARVMQETLGFVLLRVFELVAGALLLAAPMRSQMQAPEWQAEVRRYAEAQDWISAMRIVDQQAAAAPQDMDVRAWRARVLSWSGRLPEAEKEYLEILKFARNDPDDWLAQAGLISLRGEPRQELRFSQDNDLFNFTSANHAGWVSLASQWTPRWGTNFAGSFYERAGIRAGKFSGGSKADAVNAGLNAANSPYVCVVDADSVLERDALLRIMVPILEDPKRVVAVGGIIRVLNGSEIRGGTLRRVRLPRKSIEVIQVIEYLRAFLIGREAWAQGNMLTIISGAFGLFRTDLVRAVGVTGLTPSVKTLIWWLACTGICSIKVSTIKSALCPIPCAGRKSRPT